jgi:hypothetical protein
VIYNINDGPEKPQLDFLEKRPTGKMHYEEAFLDKELRGVKYSELDDPNVIFDSVSPQILII